MARGSGYVARIEGADGDGADLVGFRLVVCSHDCAEG